MKYGKMMRGICHFCLTIILIVGVVFPAPTNASVLDNFSSQVDHAITSSESVFSKITSFFSDLFSNPQPVVETQPISVAPAHLPIQIQKPMRPAPVAAAKPTKYFALSGSSKIINNYISNAAGVTHAELNARLNAFEAELLARINSQKTTSTDVVTHDFLSSQVNTVFNSVGTSITNGFTQFADNPTIARPIIGTLTVTGSATSTFNGPINIASGCFSIAGTCIGGTAVWGGITGILSAQTDLQSALDAKLSLSNYYATTTIVSRGGTGISTAPAYGQVLVGNNLGGYTLMATSSLGIASGGGTWGSITGTLSNQVDLQSALNLKFNTNAFGTNFYSLFNGTTTDALAQGSVNKYYASSLFNTDFAAKTTTNLSEGTNLYFTNTRADARINATTSIGTLTSLPNLTSIGSALSVTGTINGATISGGTLSGGSLSATAVNGVTTANIVLTSGAYADPSWITSLAGAKVSGDISGNAANVTGIVGVANGGTGIAIAPTYGQVLLGNGSGGYTLTATSSLGINSGVWGSITGTLSNQTDLQTALNAKLTTTAFGTNFYTFFSGTTTDALAQGSVNKYYATTLFNTDFAAKSTTNLSEGTNLYYTTGRAQTDARTSLLSTATGLTYTSGTGVFSLTSGYNIPLTASTTNWNTFYNTPSSQITAGTNLAWAGNTIGLSGTVAVANGGTNITNPTAAGVLLGSYAGGAYQQIATSSLGLLTTNVAEGSNLYYTTGRAQTDARNALSSSATGLTYTSGTGVFSLTSGYNIPLTASTTNWNNFFNTPSSQITAGTGLSWAGNTLNSSLTSSQWTTAGSNIYYNTGNVGIGTTTPTSKLYVNTTANADGVLINGTTNPALTYANSGTNQAFLGLNTSSGAWAVGTGVNDLVLRTQNSNIGFSTNAGIGTQMILTSTGNVGIGTTTPQTFLHVYSGASGASPIAGTLATFERNSNAYISILSPSANESGIIFGNPSSNISGNIVYNNASTLNGLQFRTNGNNIRAVIDSAGNLGIGTTSPYSLLSLAQSTSATGGIAFGDTALYRSAANTVTLGGSSSATLVVGQNVSLLQGGSGASLNFNNSTAGSILTISSNGSATSGIRLTPGASGIVNVNAGNFIVSNNVGIGTTTPFATLSVNNIAGTPGFVVGSSTATSFIVDQNGNVGIATTTPTSKLSIVGNQYISGTISQMENGDNAAYGTITLFGSGNKTGGTAFLDYTAPSGAFTDFGLLKSTTVSGNRVLIEANGAAYFGSNVGVGTSTPSAKLSVTGSGTGVTRAFVIADLNNLERFTVLNNGNVGIGTTTPTAAAYIYQTTSGVDALTLRGITNSDKFLDVRFANDATSSAYILGTGAAYFANSVTLNSQPLYLYQPGNSTYQISGSNSTANQYNNFFGHQFNVGSNGSVNAMTIDPTGKVGIGTTTPGSLLSVAGAAGGTSPLFMLSTSTAGFATSTVFTIDQNGKVGVGTTTLSSQLGIINSTSANPGLIIQGAVSQSGNYQEFRNSTGAVIAAVSSLGKFRSQAADGTAGYFLGTGNNALLSTASNNVILDLIGSNSSYFAISNDSAVEFMRVTAGGSVGVGTTTPFATLSVNNIAGTPGFVVGSSTATSFIVDKNGNVGVGTTSPGSLLSVAGAAGGTSPLFMISTSTAGFATTTAFIIDQNGKVGIGSSSPTVALSLGAGTTAASGINFGDAATNLYRSAANTLKTDGGFKLGGSLDVNGGSIINFRNASGLTTDDGTGVLDFTNTSLTAAKYISLVQSTSAFTGNGLSMDFASTSGTFTGNFILAKNAGATNFIVKSDGTTGIGTTTPWAQLSVNNIAGTPGFVVGSSTATSFIVDQNGKVGIGTSSPTQALTILGNTYIVNSSGGVSIGTNNTASGSTDSAFGYNNVASGGSFGSSAFGFNNTASGNQSSAFGYNNNALAAQSYAFGGNNIANASQTIAIGLSNSVQSLAPGSVAFGNNNSINSALNAGAFGLANTIGANGAFAFGQGITNNIASSTQIGPNDASKLTILNGGSVGIGTTSPGSALSVAGAAGGTTPLFMISNSTAGFATSTAFTVDSGGNVQIGSIGALTLDSGPAALTVKNPIAVLGRTNGATNDLASFYNTGFTRILDIIGTGNTISFVSNESNNNLYGIGFALSASNLTQASIIGSSNKGTSIVPITFGSASAVTTIAGSSSLFTGGSVGIGTTTPWAQLSVNNIAGTPGFVVGSSTATSFIVDKNGNVGIGTSSPASILGVNFTQGGTNAFTVASSTGNAFTVDKNGNILIGKNTDDGQGDNVQIAGSIRLSGNVWNSTGYWYLGQNVQINSNQGMTWSNSASVFSTNDVGLNRLSSGILKVNDGNPNFINYGKLVAAGFGVGTTSPSALLSLAGAAGGTTPLLMISTSTAGFATSTAFVVDKNGWVGVGTPSPITQFDVAGYTNPTQVGTIATGGASNPSVDYVAVQGKYAYTLPGATSSFKIYDVSTPSSPALISTMITSAVTNGIAVQGRNLYVAEAAGSKIQIYDISNVNSPQLLTTLNLAYQPQTLRIQGHYAYVVGLSSGTFQIFDVSNPAAPVSMSSTSIGDTLNLALSVSGTYAYVSGNSALLKIYNIANPAAPVLMSSFNILNQVNNMYVQGRYLYTGHRNGGTGYFKITDISNPASPTIVSTTTTAGISNGSTFVQGGYAYSAQGGTINIFDVTNPTTPVQVGTVNALTNTNSFSISGRYLYSISSGSFSIYDLGGGYIQQFEAGGIEAGTLTLRNGIQAVDGDFSGGLSVSQSANLSGSLTVTASSTAGSTLPIFSVLSPGITSPVFTALYNGSIGIGTTTPGSLLSVAGAAGGTSPLFMISTSTAGFATSTVFTVDKNGNVGIGTTSPTYNLTVNPIGGIAGQTAFFQDSTPGTGSTGVTIKGGPGQTTANSFQVLSSGGTTLFGVRGDNGNLTVFQNINTPGSNSLNLTGDRNGNGGASITMSDANIRVPISGSNQTMTLSSIFSPTSGTANFSTFEIDPTVNQSSTANGISRGLYINPTLTKANDFRALEIPGYTFNLNLSTTTLQSVLENAFTVASTSATTLTNAYEQAISGAPIASTNVTISTSTALYIGGGAVNGGGTVNNAYGLQVFAPTGATNNYAATFMNGNVGIGTTSPFNKFAVVGNSFFEGNVATPTHKGSLTNGTGGALLNGAFSVFVLGNYAYVASQSSNALEIVDVSNPAAPVHKGSLANGVGGALINQPTGVFVAGNYAYVISQGSNALEIVDVSNPAAPVHKGSLANGVGGALLVSPLSVIVSGNYAYVASGSSNALEIVDVSNPAAPVHKGSLVGGALLNTPEGVFVSGNYAYLASNTSNALEIVDISNPAAPVHKGSLVSGTGGALLTGASSLFVSGNYAYVTADGSNALEIVDISNPAAPVHKGSLANGVGGALLSSPESVYVSGNYAYVGSIGSNALEIVDISNPAAPVHKGSLANGVGGALLSGPINVFISGNYAYIASQTSNALEIVDVSGVTISNLAVGTAKVNNLSVDAFAQFNQNVLINSGLNVGGNSLFGGALTVSGNMGSTTANTPVLVAGVSDTNTSGISDVFNIFHTSTSTISKSAAGIGAGLTFSLQDASTVTGATGAGLNTATTTARIASIFTNTSTSTPTSALTFYTKNTTGSLTERMRLDANGFLGIGTTSPTSQLSVSSAGQQSATSALFSVASTTNSSIFTVLANGNVGVGTANPQSQFHYFSATSAGLRIERLNHNFVDQGFVGSAVASDITDFVFTPGAATGNSTGYLFKTYTGSTGVSALAIDKNGNVGVGSTTPFATFSVNNAAGSHAFVVGSSTATNFIVDKFGNVGVGTTSPASTLTVTGSACISKGVGATAACSTTAGTITANAFNTAAADLAERYKITDKTIEAGDVVALDTTSAGTVKKADTSNAQVLGIISTEPGFLLGSTNLDDATSRPVALSGRVPVKFSAENGSVKIGDSLTLSLTKPGYAMKVGTTSAIVIGTALEDQNSNGLLTVFVRSSLTSGLALGDVMGELAKTDTSLVGEFAAFMAGTSKWGSSQVSAVTGFFKNIFADKVTTKTLCLGDSSDQVCVTKDQLKALLNNANVTASSSPSSTPSPTQGSTPTSSGSSPSSTTTTTPIQTTSTTTPVTTPVDTASTTPSAPVTPAVTPPAATSTPEIPAPVQTSNPAPAPSGATASSTTQ